MPVILTALLIGALAGAVAGLCGVGGGILMVPLFAHFFSLDQKQAVATSLAAIIATAIAATWPNARHGLVDWRIAVPAAVGGAVVAWAMGENLKRFSNEALQILFAGLMIAVGVQMLLKALKVL